MPGEEPRPSSTVVLARPTDQSPEIFMVKRHQRASFGSRFAFPGGVLEPCDATVGDYCDGTTSAQANALLGLETGGLAYFSAAIRELFEESGVLLAEHQLSAAGLQAARDELNAGTLGWRELVVGERLRLQCDQLHYFSFWITPVSEPKRYSARFFLAELPAGQRASHDGGELTESCWMTAQQALDARKQKTVKLVYPTRKTLKRVAEIADMPALLVWARACGEKGVICDQPAFRPREIA